MKESEDVRSPDGDHLSSLRQCLPVFGLVSGDPRRLGRMWGGNGVYRARVVSNQVSRNFQFPFLFPYFPILSHFIFPAVISFLFFSVRRRWVVEIILH